MVVPVDVRSQRGVGSGDTASALAFGLLAGAVLLVAQTVLALARGAEPTLPLQLAASVPIGSAAVEGPSSFGLLVVGLLVHLALAGLYGWIYGAVHRAAAPATRASWGVQAVAGAAFGLLLWLVNLQGVARAAYPWFLEGSQVAQALLHALAYGAPLGLLFAAAAQHDPHIGPRRLRRGRARAEEPAAP